jgi:hypothetical protein
VTAPFGWVSPVFFDELDASGTLHNSRFAVHVELRGPAAGRVAAAE